jgi:hypothetical protein
MFCDYGFDFPDIVQVHVLCLRIRFSRYRCTVHHSSSVTFYSTVKKSSFLTDPNCKMVLYYHSVFLVPCVPFLCSVPFVPCSFLVVCSIYSCLLFIVSGVWSISIFSPFGISPDIPRYLRYRYPTRYRSNLPP